MESPTNPQTCVLVSSWWIDRQRNVCDGQGVSVTPARAQQGPRQRDLSLAEDVGLLCGGHARHLRVGERPRLCGGETSDGGRCESIDLVGCECRDLVRGQALHFRAGQTLDRVARNRRELRR